MHIAYYGVDPPNEALPKAKAAARAALAFDSRLGVAHALLGVVAIQYDRDWSASRAHFIRALQLNPNDPISHQLYAATYLVSTRQFDESVAELRRAHELDPLSPSINTALATALCLAGRWNEGFELFRTALELAPDFVFARYWMSQLYADRGLLAEAMAEVEKMESVGASVFAASQRGYVCALQGKRTEALRVAAQLQQLSTERYVDPVYVAEIYASLGDADSAFEWLERAYQQHAIGILRLGVVPAYTPLRSDPRFDGLLGRAGVPSG
jgi:tetratricopeptide (TPR) repeat protein